jgi:predicted secreted protein
VRAGAKFMVNLPEDHRSGYLWQLSGDYDKKILVQLNSVWHGEERGVDFNFRALSPGQTKITLFRRNYNDTSDIRCYSVRITRN